MSKKVVHLADEAHAKAKLYCKAHGLKMSDWVASLIYEAVSGQRSANPAPVQQPQQLQQQIAPPKKKIIERLESVRPATTPAPQPVAPQPQREEEVPAWAKPPFWHESGR